MYIVYENVVELSVKIPCVRKRLVNTIDMIDD